MFMFNFMETIFPIFFIIVFVIVIGTFISTGVSGFSRWKKNNDSPRLTVLATVVNKRSHVGYHDHHDANHHVHSRGYTDYYITFQVESGDRMELQVNGAESGLLVEGDTGLLTFQGTRFLGFERK